MSSIVPVTLLFSDGVAQRLAVPCGKKVVEAAAEAGMQLITDCSNGQCGTCTAQLLSGMVEMDGYDSAVLPDEDRAAGIILPCVSRVAGACAIEFPYASSEALSEEAAPIRGRVVAVRQVASETVTLEVDVAEGIHFEPGQYVRIRPEGADFHRSYSMANVPGSSHLEFYIRLVADGAFSRWLASTKAGDQVELSVPHGSFFLRDENRPRLFVAGGTGIAPFLSMLRSMQGQPHALQTTLLIGARTPGHLFALEELEALRRELPQLRLQLAVELDGGCGRHQGYATDLIAGLGLDPGTRVYLCGPPPMVEAGRKAAEAAGLPRHEQLCERFA